MRELLPRIGARVLTILRGQSGLAVLCYASLKSALLERGRGLGLLRRNTATQVYFTAVEPWALFFCAALIIGFIVIAATDLVLQNVRNPMLVSLSPGFIATVLTREVGPLLVGMILIGRSGTAISTELGYMKVRREILALETAAVNIEYLIVLPRLLGVCLATILLVLFFSITALFGGLYLAHLSGLLAFPMAAGDLLAALTPRTLAFALLKAALFGALIALSSCYHGLAVEGSFTRIPKANTAAVVQSLLICLALSAALSIGALL